MTLYMHAQKACHFCEFVAETYQQEPSLTPEDIQVITWHMIREHHLEELPLDSDLRKVPTKVWFEKERQEALRVLQVRQGALRLPEDGNRG